MLGRAPRVGGLCPPGREALAGAWAGASPQGAQFLPCCLLPASRPTSGTYDSSSKGPCPGALASGEPKASGHGDSSRDKAHPPSSQNTERQGQREQPGGAGPEPGPGGQEAAMAVPPPSLTIICWQSLQERRSPAFSRVRAASASSTARWPGDERKERGR